MHMVDYKRNQRQPFIELKDTDEAKETKGSKIKITRDMNWVILAKLAWGVLIRFGEVWGDVLRAQYGLKEDDEAHMIRKERSSQALRGVV